eukprot:196579_1
MKSEINSMRKLKHKYIVSMEETFEDKHTLYIVMEECKGGDLCDRINNRGRYKEKDAAPILKMVLEALLFMHDHHHIVHCELCTTHVLFVNESEQSPIKLIDFRMSKVVPQLRNLNELCGWTGWSYSTAPEIMRSNCSHPCDMWSVGAIMFVMMFGFPPFWVDPDIYYIRYDGPPERRGRAEPQAIHELIQNGFNPTVKKGFGPWFPKKMPVSEQSRDLMARLMELDVSKRLTAKEALGHQWIVNGGKTGNKTLNL